MIRGASLMITAVLLVAAAPAMAQSGTMNHGTMNPGTMNSDTTNSGAMKSRVMNSGAMKSRAMNSGTMKMPAGGEHMTMPMSDKPAHFAPTRAAHTTDHRFLIRLTSVPAPIPFEKYFRLRFAVFDAKHPKKEIADAQLKIFAGMRHGLKHGFAHGMQSSPKIAGKHGVFTISGMYFHMMGPWTLKATVTHGGKESVAYFELPCCGK